MGKITKTFNNGEILDASDLNLLKDTINENIDNIDEVSTISNDAKESAINAEKSAIKLTIITYVELKALRDASNLEVGKWYRITDYQCTTTQENTQSAGHQFDIIVLATDVNVLNENAYAIQHEGDTYFADCDLNAWELKYTIDNDADKYAWADSENGKGIIFWMKDEYNNECPYDFKNIQFKRYKIDYTKLYCSDCDTAMKIFANLKTNIYKSSTSTDTNYMSLYYGGQNAYDGDIYKLYITGADVKNADCYSEYTDINGNTVETEDFDDDAIFTCLCNDCDNDILAIVNNPQWFYTFSIKSTYADTPTDASLSADNNIRKNNIDIYKNSNNDDKIESNNIVFIGTNNYNNKFGGQNYCNTFGNSVESNTFGNSCYWNTFGNSVESNTFGNDCYYNTFGNYCNNNTFGNDCYYNTFGNYCYYNTFGNYCNNNTFGNSCYWNTFGNSCYWNTFGNYCTDNTFGNYCTDNTFGNSCYWNTFGNYCYYNTFGNYCNNNTFGNNVQYCGFYASGGTTPKDYVYYCTIGEGVSYCKFIYATSTSSNSTLRNIKIHSGLDYTSDTSITISGCSNNAMYAWEVARNTSGTIKQWCAADLVS